MDRRGPKPKENRRVLNRIFWVLRTGAPWRDLPERCGPYTTAYNRFNRWRKSGIWDRLMDAVVQAHDGKVQMIDSSIVRVHQQASGVKKSYGRFVSMATNGFAQRLLQGRLRRVPSDTAGHLFSSRVACAKALPSMS